MARKTVLKQLLSTYAPLSIEMQQAIIDDNVDSNVQNGVKDVTPTEATETLESFLTDKPVDNTGKPEKENSEPLKTSGDVLEADEDVYEELGLSEGETITPKGQKWKS